MVASLDVFVKDAVEKPLILLVDDNPDNLELLQLLLEAEGYAVQAVDSGQTALHQMKVSPPDLVLLDVMMPDMDGFEVVRRIRQGSFGSREANRRLRGIPIILITAYDDQTTEYGWKLGADDFIRKPIDINELLNRIQACLPCVNSLV